MALTTYHKELLDDLVNETILGALEEDIEVKGKSKQEAIRYLISKLEEELD